MAPGPKTKCCRSTPRCRRCPVLLSAELRSIRGLDAPAAGVPAHLVDVPECLHKYEPLLRRPDGQRETLPVAA